MPERATVSQQVQIGVEATATPGTAVAANKLLTALGIDLSPQFNITEFAPTGFKYSTLVALLQEWSSFSLSGYPTYTEIVYPLASVLMNATPVVTNATVNTWTFIPATGAVDVVRTYSIERGSSIRAEKTSFGVVTEFGINFSPTDANLSGAGIAKALTLGATLTGSPTSIPLVPILPTQLQVSLDATSGALGTNVLTRVLNVAWSITNRQGPLWVLNSANSSFVSIVELKPEAKIDLSLEWDAAAGGGDTSIVDLRAGTVKWMRIKATGPIIAGSTPTPTAYSMTIDAPVEVVSVGGSGDQDGVYKLDLTFRCLHDQTWGQAMKIVVVNGITGL